MTRRANLTIAAVAVLLGTVGTAPSALAVRPALTPTRDAFADTSLGVHVFNDQMTEPLTAGWLDFASTHYDGSQKQTRSTVDDLHAANPAFTVLQYKLGIGLGYRVPDGNCRPTGDAIAIIDGDSWIREWPSQVREQWFFHWQGRRVLHCVWGWYITDPDNASWRSWFLGQVFGQIADTHTDAAFFDSVSVPNYLGPDWRPALPAIDPQFESIWSAKIGPWLPTAEAGLGVPVIVNAGAWVTTRDVTDYSGASGVMIEGCAAWGSGAPLAESDWILQMDRVLSLVGLGKVVICQTYPLMDDVQLRMFALGSYLLFKDTQQYLNLEIGMDPEWFPEYAIDLGPAVDPVPAVIDDLLEQGAYVRHYENGLVVVNPGDATVTYQFGSPMYEVTPVGGGFVPVDGHIPPEWKLVSSQVTAVTLGHQEAAIALASPPR